MSEERVGNRGWTEDETVLALYLYFQLPFGKLHSGNPEIKELAAAIGRSSNSVAMKLANFASLDPKITGTGRKGLSGASKLDRALYSQFEGNWSDLVTQASAMWATSVQDYAEAVEANVRERAADFRFEPFEGETTAQAMVSLRRGQNFFRRAVLANYEETCCITGIADPRLLVASHIKPWGIDVENRHNPANGFLLSATFDKAFDRGLITIGMDRRVRVSRQLVQNANEPTRRFFSEYENKEIRAAVRFDPEPDFLDWHSRHLFIDALQA